MVVNTDDKCPKCGLRLGSVEHTHSECIARQLSACEEALTAARAEIERLERLYAESQEWANNAYRDGYRQGKASAKGVCQ